MEDNIMAKKKETILLICALIGGIADIVAIRSIFNTWNTALAFFITTLTFLLGTTIYLYMRYIERCNFLNFVEYLFDNPTHNFNLLPKICLALDKSKEINHLSVREMSIKFTYDMSRINLDSIKKDEYVHYLDTI